MSVGQAKLMAAAAAATEEFSVFMTPSNALIRMPLRGGAGSSNLITANVAGGSPPYTFSWVKQSGDNISVSSPTEQTTTFGANTSGGTFQTAVYRCTVTDSLTTETSADITASAESGL